MQSCRQHSNLSRVKEQKPQSSLWLLFAKLSYCWLICIGDHHHFSRECFSASKLPGRWPSKFKLQKDNAEASFSSPQSRQSIELNDVNCSSVQFSNWEWIAFSLFSNGQAQLSLDSSLVKTSSSFGLLLERLVYWIKKFCLLFTKFSFPKSIEHHLRQRLLKGGFAHLSQECLLISSLSCCGQILGSNEKFADHQFFPAFAYSTFVWCC